MLINSFKVKHACSDLPILDKDLLNNVIGDAHSKVSGFDSIGFVSRDQLMYMHTIMGNDPYSYNPIKPVISSSQDSPLLFGKTLFIYSPELKGFFNKNKKIDMDILNSISDLL